MRKHLKSARAIGVAGLGALALGVGALLLSALPAAALNANTNSLTFQQGATGNTALTGSQPSQTIFNIALPVNAGCSNPGSSGGNYYSFLVVEGTNLSALSYSAADAPQADQGSALAPEQPTGGYLANLSAGPSPNNLVSATYLQSLEMYSLVAIGRGQDAKVATGATPLSPTAGTALIPSGQNSQQYETGVVCFVPSAAGGPATETDYWSGPVCFTANGNDPGGFTWAPGACSGTPVSEVPLEVGLPLGGAAVVGGAVFIARRRRRPGPGQPVVIA